MSGLLCTAQGCLFVLQLFCQLLLQQPQLSSAANCLLCFVGSSVLVWSKSLYLLSALILHLLHFARILGWSSVWNTNICFCLLATVPSMKHCFPMHCFACWQSTSLCWPHIDQTLNASCIPVQHALRYVQKYISVHSANQNRLASLESSEFCKAFASASCNLQSNSRGHLCMSVSAAGSKLSTRRLPSRTKSLEVAFS